MARSVLGVGGYDEATWRLVGNGVRSGGEGHQITLMRTNQICLEGWNRQDCDGDIN